MPVGLFQQAFVSVDQDYGETGGGCASSHVPRILLVSRSIGDYELAPGRCEIAIGDIDRNPLFSLGPQTIGDQREIDAVRPIRV